MNKSDPNPYDLASQMFHGFHAELQHLKEGEVLQIDARRLRKYFQLHHNFEKGETMQSEMDKFLNMIASEYCYQYNEFLDVLIFTKEKMQIQDTLEAEKSKFFRIAKALSKQYL